MTKTVNVENTAKIRLSDIIEFCGWLSIITIVSGYIWVYTITTLDNVKIVQSFTVSDYIAYGTSPYTIFTAVVFAVNMYNVKPQNTEREKKIFFYAGFLIILFAFSSFLISAIRDVYSGSHTLTIVYIMNKVGMLVFTSAAPIGFVIAVYRPLNLSILSIALLLAAVLWINTAYNAVRFALDRSISANDSANPTIYQFPSSTYATDKWIPILTTDRYFYFLNVDNNQIEIQKSSDLIKITANSRKTP
ncbi:hypothetical protein [Rhizobium miluonense]|uniref:Uncharacterized protein n=1 Tax=Rhizobium miluonense TaxID=411945 RepID=A0ABU1SMK7_9HYPH|nr:hypothetical protein [Rhizobium miluonense]MDR6900216.1 hypothetical protein [Rhizobium miluonense]